MFMVEKCGVEEFMLEVEKSGNEISCKFLSLLKKTFTPKNLKIDLVNLKMILSLHKKIRKSNLLEKQSCCIENLWMKFL